jgi:hypothetical protein
VPVKSAQFAHGLASAHASLEVRVVWHPNLFRVRHALDPLGRPLLLCRAGGALDTALTAHDAVVLSVCQGEDQLWIAGWAAPAPGIEAALEFAAARPLGDLLDVGRGYGIYRVDVAEIRLRRGGGPMEEIDVDDYVAASSEPVR